MPRLPSDPNLSFCPNYADDAFINTRLQLTNENITEAQAIVILRNIWQAENDATKLQWQEQLNEDRDRLKNEEQERQEQETHDKEEAARKEDRKKNKHKYTAVPNLDVPLKATILPSSYALCKLDKGEYIELWYFTNDGLDDAKLKSSVDEDAMIMATVTSNIGYMAPLSFFPFVLALVCLQLVLLYRLSVDRILGTIPVPHPPPIAPTCARAFRL
ncbi:uncharacterized protein F5891DRAFT_951235 [Suillus fuscotomentosus]|uniref:Uncharacterized protein n=1 Tax=Suillus fuscotomentosus TaxID=1912939 RepID=A0AAD4HKD9_9AGAM|nr:uncharacterized protein F5891DRAFT_951235 [Suillus fuscotomentosus]KAG1900885.1 hypothetical protein F5891DRAFT_951235 [Suillus fuscotomentosus]